MNDIKEFLKQAASVKPSKRQLDWYETGMYMFVHFGLDTYSDCERGSGSDDCAIFNPTDLDCDQWVAAAKSAGFKGLVLTAKHHDGFCLWPSAYTDYCVKNSPFKGDVVKECADACRRGGIKFGFYLSPWDMHEKSYGTPAYDDYFCNQLTELLTGYGDIFLVWFDGNIDINAKVKQNYDYNRYIKLIRKYQPNACIFNDAGPDVRWVGNEGGGGRVKEWAVVPSELCYHADIQTGPGPLHDEGDLKYVYNMWDNNGTLDQIVFSKGLTFCPSEVDTMLKDNGWFWHPNGHPKTLDQLMNIYLASVGNNGCLNLDVPPNPEGKFDECDVQRLAEFGQMIKDEFKEEVPCDIELTPDSTPYLPKYSIKCKNRAGILHYIVIEEDITEGQSIDTWVLRRTYPPAETLIVGGTVGNKKIIKLGGNGYCLDYEFAVVSSRGPVKIKSLKVY